MPISAQVVRDATERYYRERDRYEKLTRTIEEKCINELMEKNGLRVNITARTKRVNSLEGKLRRFRRLREKNEWSTVEDIFENISDFSGIRVIYYDPLDLSTIQEIIEKTFNVQDIDEKDRNKEDASKFYQATHISVSEKEQSLSPDQENIKGLNAEIQICSLMAHVWNEVDHDIGYKPSGALSEEEAKLLLDLGEIKKKGEEVIQRLMEKNHERLQSEDRITDTSSLAKFLQEHFGIRRLTFNGNPGQLLKALEQLEILTGRDLKGAMGTGRPGVSKAALREVWEGAKQEIGKFNRHLKAAGRENLALSARNSADPGLFLILKNQHRTILKDFPAGQGQGRPARIRSLASAYRDFKNSQKSDQSKV